MRVKTAELKNRLSHYLRWIQESGESIEVCLRDRTVAVLRPLDLVMQREGAAGQREREALQGQMSTVGLSYEAPVVPRTGGRLEPEPQEAGDGRLDCRTVEEMRSERDW